MYSSDFRRLYAKMSTEQDGQLTPPPSNMPEGCTKTAVHTSSKASVRSEALLDSFLRLSPTIEGQPIKRCYLSEDGRTRVLPVTLIRVSVQQDGRASCAILTSENSSDEISEYESKSTVVTKPVMA